MAKHYGQIGFSDTVETDPLNHPGVYRTVITEKYYYMDVNSWGGRWDSSSVLNDNFNVRNEFSILADPFATEHFANMRYITWLGTKWKITGANLVYPRIILSIGGIWNEQSE